MRCEESGVTLVKTECELSAVLADMDQVFYGRDVAISRSRELRMRGEHRKAFDLLATAISGEHAKNSKLWSELASLVETDEDYDRVRRAWFTAPAGCARNVSIIRSVARSAMLAGNHSEARDLLKRGILIVSGRREKRRVLLVGKRVLTRLGVLPNKGRGKDGFEARASEALKALNDAFSEFGVRPFLISGTLLGYIRDRSFIGWDKDVDVGVFSEECPEDLKERIENDVRFSVRKLDSHSERIRVNHFNGIGIDIFPHYWSDGLRWHDGAATRWWNTGFDLKEIQWLGIKQLIPTDPERYLDENYGDWRKPQRDFDARIDAPNVEVSDDEYFLTLLYGALLKAVQSDNGQAVRRYLALLDESDGGGWLERIPEYRLMGAR